MRFKKIISLMLVLIMIFSLVACNAKNVGQNAVEKAALDYFTNYPDDKNLIHEKKFIEKLSNGEELFILDIRSAEDYKKGHLRGAVNIPWKEVGNNLDKLPADKTIYVLCYSGQTAGQTVALLNVAGFNAKSVRYGMVRGISKQDGYEDIIETGANEFPEVKKLSINPEVKKAIVEYFQDLKNGEGIYSTNIISAETANSFSNDDSVVFLSIRKPEDYAKAHIPGAINIPFGKGMQKNFNKLPKDKTIIVYCYSGQTAGQTVAILRLLGYDAVSLHSGMGTKLTGNRGWSNEGYPTESK